jgi:hypothetical protein
MSSLSVFGLVFNGERFMIDVGTFDILAAFQVHKVSYCDSFS